MARDASLPAPVLSAGNDIEQLLSLNPLSIKVKYVQGELVEAVSTLLGKRTYVHGASRTDAGVSAVATSDEIINDVVITSLSDSQLSSLVITVLVAAALLVVNFLIESRRPFLGLITIFPVALVMLWAFGLMPVLGGRARGDHDHR